MVSLIVRLGGKYPLETKRSLADQNMSLGKVPYSAL